MWFIVRTTAPATGSSPWVTIVPTVLLLEEGPVAVRSQILTEDAWSRQCRQLAVFGARAKITVPGSGKKWGGVDAFKFIWLPQTGFLYTHRGLLILMFKNYSKKLRETGDVLVLGKTHEGAKTKDWRNLIRETIRGVMVSLTGHIFGTSQKCLWPSWSWC